MPRIVVAMGVYNEAQYLQETISAVLNQTMPDFGFCILDNGSTDKSWEILQYFADVDERIVIRRSPINLRCPDAANSGWLFCMSTWPNAKWFLGVGADDVIDPDYLETILAVSAAKPNVNLIFSPARFINHPERGVYTYPSYDPARVHLQLQIPGWRAITRELWNANGPEWTGINEGSDWEWIVRASIKGILRPYQLPRSYLSLRIRTDRLSQSDLADKAKLHARLCALMHGAPNDA